MSCIARQIDSDLDWRGGFCDSAIHRTGGYKKQGIFFCTDVYVIKTSHQCCLSTDAAFAIVWYPQYPKQAMALYWYKNEVTMFSSIIDELYFISMCIYPFLIL